MLNKPQKKKNAKSDKGLMLYAHLSLKYITENGLGFFLAKVLNFLSHRLSPAAHQPTDILLRFNPKDIFPSKVSFSQHWKNVSPDLFKAKQIFLITDCDIRPEILKHAEILNTTRNLSDEVVRNSVFYIYFLCDSDALPEIRRIINCGGIFVPHLNTSKTHYRFINRHALDAMRATLAKNDRISHFHSNIHENICEALELTKNLDGDYVEIGVYKGGSALTALNYLRNLRDSKNNKVNRKAWLLDTFDGFTYDEAQNSSDAIWAGTHKLFGVKETMDYIRETLTDIGVDFELVQANICSDMLPIGIKKIAVANIDVDMFEPTRDSLLKISPLVVEGGIIMCEDPASTPALYGALLAMEDFLATQEGQKYIKIFKHGQYFLIRWPDRAVHIDTE